MTEKNLSLFDNKLDLAPIEESIKNQLTSSDIKPGLRVQAAFGRGGLGDVESFGNKTLRENAIAVDKALDAAHDLQRVWNRSHSNWLWRHVNLTYHSPQANFRQLAAEIQSKRQTISSAKWNQLKQEIEIQRIQDRLAAGNFKDQYEETEIMMALAQAKEGMSEGMAYIEGCMKDILELSDLLDQMKEKYGSFTEEDIEKEEVRNHLRRSLVQCLRDVRQTNTISKGEQEYLEQIGANVGKVLAKMREYVTWEQSDEAPWDSRGLFHFIDDLTELLADTMKVGEIRMEMLGLEEKVNTYNTYNEKVATRLAQVTKEEE